MKNEKILECGIYDVEKPDKPCEETDQETLELKEKLKNLEFENKTVTWENKRLMMKISRLEDTIKCFKIREENKKISNRYDDDLSD